MDSGFLLEDSGFTVVDFDVFQTPTSKFRISSNGFLMDSGFVLVDLY